MILIPSQPVKYRGTLTGLRISAVDGTAFFDNCAALVPYADGSHLVEIYDASGRMLRGYLGAAGDGEDLGDELITTWGNDPRRNLYLWDTLTVNANGRDVDSAISDGVGVSVANSNALGGAGWLLKRTLALTLNSGGLPTISSAYWTGSAYAASDRNPITGNSGDYYFTVKNANTDLSFYSSLPSNSSSTNSCKQVTAPSTSGATIVSAKGGGTANFQYKNASFTYNEASYYCLIKRAR